MKKIVDLDKWNKDFFFPIHGENQSKFNPSYRETIIEVDRWLQDQPDAEEKRLYKTKKYTINYGYGGAVLYTPYDCEERFYTLANTCFGIRKSIMCCDILETEDAEIEDFERLEFGGDVYVWRKDGARKCIDPEYFADEDWNEDYCEKCRYKGEEE